MQSRSNANYYRHRAEEERAAADAANGKKSRELHLNLAEAYERAALREPGRVPSGDEDAEGQSWVRPMTVVPQANDSWRDRE
jgi:hypothetical protein